MKKKRGIINALYLFLWFTPLFLFWKDFWSWGAIEGSDHTKLIHIVLFTWKQSLLSTFFSFFIAIIPAIYFAYHKNTLSKFLDSLLFIPFFFPVISTIAVFSLFWNLPFLQEFSILYTVKAIILAHVFYNSPIFVKYIGEALKKIPKEIEEALILDGASPWIIFWKGQLPLIFPQVLKAFILCFTYCFLSFAIVLSLGGIRYQTLEVEIYSTLIGDFNFSKVILYGGLQFLILLSVNSLSLCFQDYELKGNFYRKETSVISAFFSFLYIVFEYGIVIASIVASFYNYFTGEFSWKGYAHIFSKEFQMEYPIFESLANSIFISTIAAFFTVMFAYLLLCYYSRVVELILFSNLAISGAFYAIVLYYIYVLFNIPLYLLLLFGYLMVGIPLAYSFLYQNVKAFPRDLEEMAYLDGLTPAAIFWRVRFPILRPLFISTFLQLFAIFLGEFTLAYAMQLGDIFPIVSIVNYSLLADKKYLENFAFSGIILALILLLFILGEWLKNKGETE